MAFDDIFGDLIDDIEPIPTNDKEPDKNNTNNNSWDTGKPSSIWTIKDTDVWSTEALENN